MTTAPVDPYLAWLNAGNTQPTAIDGSALVVAGTYAGQDDGTPWGLRALDEQCATVANTPTGGRNDALNRAAFRLGQAVAGGQLRESAVMAGLAKAVDSFGDWPSDSRSFLATVRSGLRAGATKPRGPEPGWTPPQPPPPTVLRLAGGTAVDTATGEILTPPAAPDPDEAFWTARPHLERIRTYARARLTSPYAVLAIVLTRVVTASGPFVVLPPIVGGHASLNQYVGIVGPSGAGKGAAEAAARDVVQLPDPISTATPGSGEGIAHAYVKRTKDGVEQHTDAVLFTVAEIDTLASLGARRGATLLPELRRAWDGAELGFQYADASRRLPVAAHTYRLCLVAGIQPARAGALLDDADGGTPQRFLWVPATDPGAPDVSPDAPAPIVWRRPKWPIADHEGKSVLPVWAGAVDQIRAARLETVRTGVGSTDGHALLARLKLAAAFALLDERAEVSEDDWALAGHLHAISQQTRASVETFLAERARTVGQAKAEQAAAAAVLSDERVETAKVARVSKVLLRKLQGATEGLGRAELRRAAAGPDRTYVDAALDALAVSGQVVAEPVEYRGQMGERFRLS